MRYTIVRITCHNNLSKQPITTNCLIKLINQIIYSHQGQSPRQLSKMDTNNFRFPIQSPWYISIMMEPLSHYHYEIYYCKPLPINLHQTTSTNNLNHASAMHRPVPQPVINLYHKQVHQTCTNLYQTTCNQHVP
jgi:hypothetical protein